MAKKKNKADTGVEVKLIKAVPLLWDSAYELPTVYANEAYIVQTQGEFYIVFGESQPVVSNEQPEVIHIKPIVKIALAHRNMVRIANAINQNMTAFTANMGSIADSIEDDEIKIMSAQVITSANNYPLWGLYLPLEDIEFKYNVTGTSSGLTENIASTALNVPPHKHQRHVRLLGNTYFKYKIIQDIDLQVGFDGDTTIVHDELFPVYGVGDNQEEAIEDYISMLFDLFEDLTASEGVLSDYLLHQLLDLRKVVVRLN